MLKEIGITNAEAIVNQSYATALQEVEAAKQALGISTDNLSDLTLEEIQRLLEEGHYSEQAKNKLYELYLMQINLTSNPIDASNSINQLLGMVGASSAAGSALVHLAGIMDKIQQLRARTDSIDNPWMKAANQTAITILEKQAASIKETAMKNFHKMPLYPPLHHTKQNCRRLMPEVLLHSKLFQTRRTKRRQRLQNP